MRNKQATKNAPFGVIGLSIDLDQDLTCVESHFYQA